jgi:hypothetical protein
MRFVSYLVYKSSVTQDSVAAMSTPRFMNVGTGASDSLAIETQINSTPLRNTLFELAVKNLSFGAVTQVSIWRHYFGTVTVQLEVEVDISNIADHAILQWDQLTDPLQETMKSVLTTALGDDLEEMWTTTLLLCESTEPNTDLIMAKLPFLTKTRSIPNSGFINRGLCGIGISYLEYDQPQATPEEHLAPPDVLAQSVRSTIAFCAGIYIFHQGVLAEYTKYFTDFQSKSSKTATQFRYFESIRAYTEALLGPNERIVAEGLWSVWDMEKEVDSVAKTAERLETEIAQTRQRSISHLGNSIAICGAGIAALVAVEPVRKLFDLTQRTMSNLAVLAGLFTLQLLVITGIVFSARQKRKNRD